PARAARLARAGGGGGFGIPGRLHARGARRLLQRHQPRAADRWCRARLERSFGVQLPEFRERAGSQCRRDRWDRALRGDPGRSRRTRGARQCRALAAGAGAHTGGGMNATTGDVLSLVREDLRDFAGYSSARSSKLDGEIWLNANESAWGNAADTDASCRRYPDPQPAALCAALAGLYGVDPARLIVGRGSDEAIDLLVRATCAP